ncbi:unnamed protein product (mitochondrion) [Plasmodiophora brassicae]|uniref:Uncharacterized protein n=1 Tax=Plasmodiophora brassicae TaxID=37360 RepID=A0A0G4IIP7_PLABS|nr:hypothetical protein PBRA_009608 [Plasmodiophora brassicae]SPR01497.1 unnamed protein product [Plasmodiophora brassicae]
MCHGSSHQPQLSLRLKLPDDHAEVLEFPIARSLFSTLVRVVHLDDVILHPVGYIIFQFRGNLSADTNAYIDLDTSINEGGARLF